MRENARCPRPDPRRPARRAAPRRWRARAARVAIRTGRRRTRAVRRSASDDGPDALHEAARRAGVDELRKEAEAAAPRAARGGAARGGAKTGRGAFIMSWPSISSSRRTTGRPTTCAPRWQNASLARGGRGLRGSNPPPASSKPQRRGLAARPVQRRCARLCRALRARRFRRGAYGPNACRYPRRTLHLRRGGPEAAARMGPRFCARSDRPGMSAAGVHGQSMDPMTHGKERGAPSSETTSEKETLSEVVSRGRLSTGGMLSPRRSPRRRSGRRSTSDRTPWPQSCTEHY